MPVSMRSKSKKSTRKAKSASSKNGKSTSSRSTRSARDENEDFTSEMGSSRRSEGRGTPSYYDDRQMSGGSRRQLDRWTDDQEIEDRRSTGRFVDNDDYEDEGSYRRSGGDRSMGDIERGGSRSYRADEERYESSGSRDWDRMERGGSRRGSREDRDEDYGSNERFGSRQDRYGANDYGYRDDREGYSMSETPRRDLRDFENDEDLHEGTRGTRMTKRGSDHKSDRNLQSNRGSRSSRRV